jgi:hypothetical protein
MGGIVYLTRKKSKLATLSMRAVNYMPDKEPMVSLSKFKGFFS